ncbi:TonB-dependent receptor plug domain-containing protein [Bacteroides sp.]|uniref:TonB-dependent receptor plug domain-containing protein n=1 Tax=Bacteroides sp. TaxID=29523 RepID=UPI0034CFCF1F
MKIRFCLLFLLFTLLTGGMVAQNTIDVTGVVHDEDGESIIGASVKVKGTLRGTITDIDGKFRLPGVKAGEILQFSFVGYAGVEEKAARQMNVVMHPVTEQLDEVIVTAFGTAKKSAFTGSATVLNSDKIEQKQVTNVMSSLIGEVPGLQIAPTTSPGSASSILIRGEGSINADNDPLIVLDGMPYDGLWNDINPQDVESVTVLKDAASNALYGARGANGVIIVTTKKGQKGKATVTLNAKWGGEPAFCPRLRPYHQSG